MKIPAILLLMVCFFSASGQSWCPPGASWYYEYVCPPNGGVQHLYYSGDTTIRGINCKRISGTSYFSNGQGNGIDSAFTAPIYSYELGDTIYYLHDTTFSPYIYLNAQAGDTIKMLNNGDSLISAVVDSNGKVVINNDSLRYYYFHFIDLCWADKVIERMGLNTSYLIPNYPFCQIDDCYNQLSCYGDNVFPIYTVDTINGCFELTIGVPDLYANNYIAIRPNPVRNYAAISCNIANWNNKDLCLTVSNLLGQVIFTKPLITPASIQEINTSGFADGIYNISIKRKDTIIAVTRMVKQ